MADQRKKPRCVMEVTAGCAGQMSLIGIERHRDASFSKRYYICERHMKMDTVSEICKKYAVAAPGLDSAMGKGWAPIVDTMIGAFAAIGFTGPIGRVAEHKGALTVDVNTESLTDLQKGLVQELIKEANKQARRTCEACGAGASFNRHHGKTLCRGCGFKHRDIKFHHFSNAGVTLCVVGTDEKVSIGASIVGKGDQFSRELGRSISLGRAIKQRSILSKKAEQAAVRDAIQVARSFETNPSIKKPGRAVRRAIETLFAV